MSGILSHGKRAAVALECLVRESQWQKQLAQDNESSHLIVAAILESQRPVPFRVVELQYALGVRTCLRRPPVVLQG